MVRIATLTAPGQGTGALELTWQAPGSTGGRTISSYEWRFIEGSTASGSTNGNQFASSNGAIGVQHRYQVRACNARSCGEWTASSAATPQAIPIPPPWTPTNSTTVTQRTCPEPQSTYNNPPTNDAQGCTMNSRGYLEPGTIVDAVCRSVRNGQDLFYMRIDGASYDGWFIRAAHTNRGGTSVNNC